MGTERYREKEGEKEKNRRWYFFTKNSVLQFLNFSQLFFLEIYTIFSEVLQLIIETMLIIHNYSIIFMLRLPYFLDQTPPSNSRRTQIVAASFTYRSFIVAALELSPHILIRAHLPRLEAVSACLRYTSVCTMYY